MIVTKNMNMIKHSHFKWAINYDLKKKYLNFSVVNCHGNAEFLLIVILVIIFIIKDKIVPPIIRQGNPQL